MTDPRSLVLKYDRGSVMMNIWISHILFSFLPFFNDLVPNITYSGFHSCYLKHRGCGGFT